MSNETFIHPTTHISFNAKIGQSCKVWINVQIREHAKIGQNCIISKDVYIDHAVKIGNGCKVQNSVSIYHGVEIGNDVFIGPNACFTNDKVPRAFNTDRQVTETYVGTGASIGANATIVCGVRIGEYAMMAAGSVVTKNVPQFILVAGNPARPMGMIDKAGNRVSDESAKPMHNKAIHNKTLKVRLIDLGKMGRNHLRVLSMLKGVELTFIADADGDLAQKAAALHGTLGLAEPAPLLNTVDVVVICTPTVTHGDHIKLTAGQIRTFD